MPPKRRRNNKRKRPAPPPAVVPPEHESSIKDAFDTYADDKGKLSVKRVKQALKDGLNISIKKEEIRAVASESSMDYTQFARFCTNKLRQQSKSETAFGLFDKDGKGLVCLQDLQRVAQELGEDDDMSQEDLEEMMHEADPSGEGLLDRDAFFRIVRKLNL